MSILAVSNSSCQKPRTAYQTSSASCATYPSAIQINRGRLSNQPDNPTESPSTATAAVRIPIAANPCVGEIGAPRIRESAMGSAPAAEATTPMATPAIIAGIAASPHNRRVGA